MAKLDLHLVGNFCHLNPCLHITGLLTTREVVDLQSAPGFEFILKFPVKSLHTLLLADGHFRVRLLPNELSAISIPQDHALVLLRVVRHVEHRLLVLLLIVANELAGDRHVLNCAFLMQHSVLAERQSVLLVLPFNVMLVLLR